MNLHEEIAEMLADLDLFHNCAVDLFARALERDDMVLADGIKVAATGHVPRPDGPDLPVPGDGPWQHLRACVSHAEHVAWARFMFAALESGDAVTVDRIEALIARRCAS